MLWKKASHQTTNNQSNLPINLEFYTLRCSDKFVRHNDHFSFVVCRNAQMHYKTKNVLLVFYVWHGVWLIDVLLPALLFSFAVACNNRWKTYNSKVVPIHLPVGYFLTKWTFSLQEDSPVFFTDKDKINEVDLVDTQERMASLHTTFDIVCDISRSTKNSLITKQELFHNILANNLEIEEIGNEDHLIRVPSKLYLMFPELCWSYRLFY